MHGQISSIVTKTLFFFNKYWGSPMTLLSLCSFMHTPPSPFSYQRMSFRPVRLTFQQFLFLYFCFLFFCRVQQSIIPVVPYFESFLRMFFGVLALYRLSSSCYHALTCRFNWIFPEIQKQVGMPVAVNIKSSHFMKVNSHRHRHPMRINNS